MEYIIVVLTVSLIFLLIKYYKKLFNFNRVYSRILNQKLIVDFSNLNKEQSLNKCFKIENTSFRGVVITSDDERVTFYVGNYQYSMTIQEFLKMRILINKEEISVE